ncbi:hypothetical protein BEP19_00735 [Ammoniphilus oxalaticus]|uniref:HTH marR-type domain-containing protein n=1 Tax=Ammoniphilus oxalaticus TaxID=66863 RepID=A0A419SMJ0_9BACL|nr:MarR family transcriptional regulator [Ammoniphilus oxalaticus]RKD25505.1 hypothetical protein BEP19_00735 [Ammoniphilus oxalaticus]
MEEHQNKMTSDLHITMNIIRAMYKIMEEDWTRQAKRYDLTSPQQHLLSVLHFHDGSTITEIANLGLWHISTAMHLIDRVEEKGLVRKERLRHDKRASRVFLTEKGQGLREKMAHEDLVQSRLLAAVIKKRDEHGFALGSLRDFGLAVAQELYGKGYVDYLEKSSRMIDAELAQQLEVNKK